jgi:hypothetical protein
MCSNVVTVGKNVAMYEFIFCFRGSPKPESNRHLQFDEIDMLPLHHQGTVEDVCTVWCSEEKEKDDTEVPSFSLQRCDTGFPA